VSFRRRTFPEVRENLLTEIVGGVSAESHPFPPGDASGPPFRHSLQQPPVADVVSVYGSRDGQPHQFRKDADFKLLPDRQTLEWQSGADLPDLGTLVMVNYVPAAAQPVLTDLQTGSVVRTLAETVALEIARLYAQLDAVYAAGFVDTASGSSLDNVVALLGVERVQGGRAAGEVELTRAAGSRGIITIPAGTRVTTVDGNVEYATTDTVTMAEGQTAIRVVARDQEPNDPLPAGALTVLPIPIAGIAGVTNPAPTALTTRDETDDELRERARNFLHGSERATLGAIKQAIARQGISADVEELADSPGEVQITPHAETLPPELQQRLLTAIEDARPAGVGVRLVGALAPRPVALNLRLTTASGLLDQDLRAIQRTVRDRVGEYFASLPAREAGSVNRIVGLILSVPQVQDVRLLSATWTVDGAVQDVLDRDNGLLQIGGFPTVLGDLQIADPALATLLSVVVTHPQDAAPPDVPAIRTAVGDAITYLNDLNASEPPATPAEQAKRVVSYGKLLRVIPLPGKPGASLAEFDTASAAGTAPALPTETTVQPYGVQVTFTLASGLTRILASAADAYTLVPFERLALDRVERAGGGADA